MRLIDVLLTGLVHVALFVRSAASCPSQPLAANLSEEYATTHSLNKHLRRYLRERCEFRLDTIPDRFREYVNFNSTSLDVLVQKIDRERCQLEPAACSCHPSGSPCYATLSVSVLQDHKLQCSVTITFTIVDANDNAPTWPEHTGDHIELRFNENEPGGIVNTKLIAATDADAPGPNSQLSYRLVPNTADFMVIDGRNGLVQLRAMRTLDRETRANYSFRLEAFDHGVPSRTSSIALIVLVDDVNDHPPTFSSSTYNVTVNETLEVGEPVLQVRATDSDSGSLVTYDIVEHTDRGTFRINDDGVVHLAAKLDFESRQAGQPFYRFTVIASDNGSPQRSSSAIVVVQVRDVNDHPPSVRVRNEEVSVSENLPRGSYAARISVDDVDYGPVRCSLPSDPPYYGDTSFASRPFELKEDVQTGIGLHRAYTLLTATELDREQMGQHIVQIVCTDLNGHTNGLSATATVTVNVADVNDNAPLFNRDQLTFSVPETDRARIGMQLEPSEVGYVTAHDADEGVNSQINYSILPMHDANCFSIDEHTGRISVLCQLDREQKDTLWVQVLATDGGSPPRNTSTLIRINVTDVNDCVPKFTSDRIVFNVEESASYTRVGSLLGYVRDCDVGRNAQLSFKLNHADQSEEAKRFTVNAQGELYTLSELDREAQPSYSLSIVVHDNGEHNQLSSTATIVVHIADINDNAPAFGQMQTTFNVSCLERLGYVITRLTAVDRDAEENGTVRYDLASTGYQQDLFAINNTSGELYVANNLVSAKGNYKLKIVATDRGKFPRNSSIEVNISIDSVSPASGSNRRPDDVIDIEASSNIRQNSLADPSYDSRDSQSERGPYEKANEIVIISLAAIFIVLLFVTVALIVWLKRKDTLPVGSAKRNNRKAPGVVKHEAKPLADKERNTDTDGDDDKSVSALSRPTCYHAHHSLPLTGYQSVDLGDKHLDDDAPSDIGDDEQEIENSDGGELEHGSGYESPDSCEVDDGSRSRTDAAGNPIGQLRHVSTLPLGIARTHHAHSSSFQSGRQLVAVHTPHVHSHMLDPSQLPFNIAHGQTGAGLASLPLGAHGREPLSLIRCEPPLKYGGAVTLPPQAYNDYNPLRVAHTPMTADRVLHLATPLHQATMLAKQRQLAYPSCTAHRRHAHAHPHSASAGNPNSHLYYEINGTNVTSDCSESVCAYMSNALDANANSVGLSSLPRPAAPAPLGLKASSAGEPQMPLKFGESSSFEQTSKKVGPLYGEASYV